MRFRPTPPAVSDVVDGVDTGTLGRLDLDLLMNALERDFAEL